MDCTRFQDAITDYLDGTLDPRSKAECAAHRLTCRECRELLGDVRGIVQSLNYVATNDLVLPEGLEGRIIAATSAGEMLSCADFDALIERYFDGVILAPTFQTFQAHFEKCRKCRRLMTGIEDAIEMCHEVKEAELEVPDELNDRIVAATSGGNSGWFGSGGLLAWLSGLIFNPQMAVAALIFAAGMMYVIYCFGSFGGMASTAGTRAEILVSEGQKAIYNTEAMARTGYHRFSSGVNSFFFAGDKSLGDRRKDAPATIWPAPDDRVKARGEREKRESQAGKTRGDSKAGDKSGR